MALDTDSERKRIPTLLAASAIGVYLLIIVGATTAISHAARACSTWPVCGTDFSNPQLLIAWGHRIAALLVGIVVLVTLIAVWRSGAPRRAKAILVVPFVGYPVQIGLGALAATTSLEWVTTVHLLCGMAIFVSLIAALAWTLEWEVEPESEAPLDHETTDRNTPDPIATDSPVVKVEPTGLARAKAVGTAYFTLMKPRLMWLLCLVAAAAMALAAGTALESATVLTVLSGGVLAIGASGTFNHVLERDIDRRMNRTADRPLATDQVGVRNALIFGTVLAALSLALFASVNLLTAALGLCAILFYSVIYTLVLKPNTVQNTVIGGAAGALPALIGWVAVTGKIGLGGLALAGVIFLWTPAHFYNLALAYKDDYERADFPMLPVVRGNRITRRHILWYLAATLLAASLLTWVTSLGWFYAGVTVAFGALFLWTVVRLHREQDRSAAFRAFHASNAYLGALLVAIVIDAVVV